jgi:hypothetical protein
VPNTPEVLADARAHWADHCATCHANDGSGDTFMGWHTYPPAPDMRLPATQRMTDGELFYIIQNGIRLTAMPAWGGGSEHDALDSWELVRFIRHLPNLTEGEKAQMEKLNHKSPAELKEEEEEERFLKGEDSNEQTTLPMLLRFAAFLQESGRGGGPTPSPIQGGRAPNEIRLADVGPRLSSLDWRRVRDTALVARPFPPLRGDVRNTRGGIRHCFLQGRHQFPALQRWRGVPRCRDATRGFRWWGNGVRTSP